MKYTKGTWKPRTSFEYVDKGIKVVAEITIDCSGDRGRQEIAIIKSQIPDNLVLSPVSKRLNNTRVFHEESVGNVALMVNSPIMFEYIKGLAEKGDIGAANILKNFENLD
jgi:hypothetical protein